MKFSESVKALVLKRSNARCEKCGIPIRNGQYHHRRPRGMGGSKSQVTGSAANAVLLHPKCHEQIERNRAESLEKGWLVRQSQDPEQVPIYLGGRWVLLQSDGSEIPVEPPVAVS